MVDSAAQSPASPASLRIGSWTLHEALNRIERGDVVVHLEPKAVDVLKLLADRPGEPISRQELLQAAWPGLVVSDDALTQVIIKLRKALGDDPRSPEYIQTIPKRGYRLVADVAAWEDSPRPAARSRSFHRWIIPTVLIPVVGLLVWIWISPEPEPDPERVPVEASDSPGRSQPMSIMVLPFEQIGDAEGQHHLAQGIAADVGTDLSKLSGLWVINASVSDPSRAPARYLVSGSVQRLPGRILVFVQLVATGTGHQVWSERYDRPIGDLFDLQHAISREIVSQLAIQMSAAEHERLAKRYTRNLEAYDFFLRGQSDLLLRQREANRTAREWYRKAIEQDPNFARAYAGLALSYTADYRNQWSGNRAESLQHATAMAESALQIDPDIPQVHWVLGYVAAQKRQHDRALESLQNALDLDQSFADAYALMGGINTYKGQSEKSIPLLREAIRLRPDAGYLYYLLLGRAYFFLGDQEQAGINLREALARNPTNLEARLYLAAVEVAAGDLEGANWEADEIRTLKPDFDLSGWFETYPMTDPAQIAKLSGALEVLGL